MVALKARERFCVPMSVEIVISIYCLLGDCNFDLLFVIFVLILELILVVCRF